MENLMDDVPFWDIHRIRRCYLKRRCVTLHSLSKIKSKQGDLNKETIHNFYFDNQYYFNFWLYGENKF